MVASRTSRLTSLVLASSILATVQTLRLPSVATSSACNRRDALSLSSSAAVAAWTWSSTAPSFAAAPPQIKKSEALLQPELVLILRVQEATGQETRLVKTGKYKELQRLNIKRAVSMMIDNYDIRDRFVRASAYAPPSNQQAALSEGQVAVESLIQILEYFPDKLQANDLTKEQAAFVLAALNSVTKSIDAFLDYMPASVVEKARTQIAEENQLNVEEYPKDEPMLNFGTNEKASAQAPAQEPVQAPAQAPVEAPAAEGLS